MLKATIGFVQFFNFIIKCLKFHMSRMAILIGQEIVFFHFEMCHTCEIKFIHSMLTHLYMQIMYKV
jgi:hypothetical protein